MYQSPRCVSSGYAQSVTHTASSRSKVPLVSTFLLCRWPERRTGVVSYREGAKISSLPVASRRKQALCWEYHLSRAPISLECRVREITSLGSHDLFLADIVGVRADEQYIDPETGAFDMKRAGLLVYAHGEYFGLGEYIGHFGWSVRKKKTKRR